MASESVYIKNPHTWEKDITLTDGTNVHLGPFSRTGQDCSIGPISRSLLPPSVTKKNGMAARGEIILIDA
jgi:hypothetical protein